MKKITLVFAFLGCFTMCLLAQNKEGLRTEVKDYKGRPTFYINGTPTLPQFYALTDRPTGNRTYETIPSHSISQFAQVGFKLYQVDLWFEEMLFEDGTLDITEAQKQIQGVLKHCPDAAIMFRLHCNPPFWWLKQHPEECTKFADVELMEEPYRPSNQNYLWQDLNNVPRCSYASKLWLSFMGKQVKDFCQRLAATPEGNSLMGIQLVNGVNGENHYWAFVKHDPDVSEVMNVYFREWLTKKYKDDKSLQKAWNNPNVHLADATVPGMERHESQNGIFRDPMTEKRTIDYYECQHKVVTESIDYFAKIVKENWPRPIAVGCFYGYYTSMFGRQAAGGHLLEQDVMTSPYIDFMSAPQAYNGNSRKPGGPGLSRGMIESVRLHGKVWLDEMDQPSHLGHIYLGGLQDYDIPGTIQITRKFVLNPFLRGAGMWYYDFGPIMTTGWWDDPHYMEEISNIRKVEEKYFDHQLDAPADVLFVFDTKVFFYTTSSAKKDPISDQISVNISAFQAFRSGASIATCYFSDLQNMDLDQYKTIVFVNCYLMDKEQRAWINKNVAKNQRNLVWLTAPAYMDGQTLNTKYVSEVTGMTVDTFYCDTLPVMHFNEAFGDTVTLIPPKAKMENQVFFRVNDPKATTLATFDQDGYVAAAMKKQKDATQVFLALPPTKGTMWNKLFHLTGSHVYDDGDDSIIAGMGLVMVHTQDGGPRDITLKNGKVVHLEMTPMQTVLMDAVTGEILLQ